jgi:hypothetical protein
MARHWVLTAVYLIIAWALMVSYQIFTHSALATVAASLSGPVPLVASWLRSSSDLAGFICSFAWMFVLSAIVSQLMFGRERRLSVQFLVSLGLTLIGSLLVGLLSEAGLDVSNPNVLSNPFNAAFGNAPFAWFYLALPFIFMLLMDFRVSKKKKK